jgi:hypothetical protein
MERKGGPGQPGRYHRDMHKFLLRIPEPLWVELVQAATDNGRSIHREILHRLQVSFSGYRV